MQLRSRPGRDYGGFAIIVIRLLQGLLLLGVRRKGPTLRRVTRARVRLRFSPGELSQDCQILGWQLKFARFSFGAFISHELIYIRARERERDPSWLTMTSLLVYLSTIPRSYRVMFRGSCRNEIASCAKCLTRDTDESSGTFLTVACPYCVRTVSIRNYGWIDAWIESTDLFRKMLKKPGNVYRFKAARIKNRSKTSVLGYWLNLILDVETMGYRRRLLLRESTCSWRRSGGGGGGGGCANNR